MPRITGGQAVVQALLAHGVKYVFGLPGSSVQDIVDALVDHPQMEFILALHEGSLVSMADGYARASGRPAFVLVHMLPGTSNLVGGLYNAWRDGSPVVVASGQQDTRLLGRGGSSSRIFRRISSTPAFRSSRDSNGRVPTRSLYRTTPSEFAGSKTAHWV